MFEFERELGCFVRRSQWKVILGGVSGFCVVGGRKAVGILKL